MGTLQRTKRYCTQLAWLVRNLDGGNARLAIGSIMAQFVGIGAMAAFLLLLFRYLENRENTDTSDPILQWFFGQPLIIVTAALVTIGLVGAYSLFLGETLAVRLSRHLHPMYVALASRTIAVQGTIEDIQRQYSTASPLRIIGISPRYAAISTRRIVSMFAPILSVVGGMASLLLLSWQSTLILIVVGICFAATFSRLNIRAARLQHAYHNTSGSTSRRARELLSESSEAGRIPNVVDFRRGLQASPEVTTELDALYGKMLLSRASNLLTTGFMVIAICLIVATTMLLFKQQDWAFLLGYLVMLRVTAAGVKQIANVLVTVSRFFPEVEKLQIADASVRRNPRPTLDGRSMFPTDASHAEEEEITG